MKKRYFLAVSKTLIVVFLLCFEIGFCQVQFNLVNTNATLMGINDAGQGVTVGHTYDFASNTITPIDSGAFLSGINNNGDIIGSLPLVLSGQNVRQPAYKKNGVWYPMGLLPGSTVDEVFNINDISENGNYITGDISTDCCHKKAFLYNVTTGLYQILQVTNYSFFNANGVNNAGTVIGTHFGSSAYVPYYELLGSTLAVTPAPTTAIDGFSVINNSNVIAGGLSIYNLNTNSCTNFALTAGAMQGNFTGISENGTAVGYGPSTEAIIYHPSLGNMPLLLKNVLTENGVPFTTTLGLVRGISPNGNYICGSNNAGQQWALNLINTVFTASFIQCPENIERGDAGMNVVNYTLPYAYGQHPAATIVLVAGLPSGSNFPVGATQVVHNLVDTDGTILDTCSFTVTVHSLACNPVFDNVEAITKVAINSWQNLSAANSTAPIEDFTGSTGYFSGIDWPQVTIGPVYLEGNTAGNWTDYFTIFVDWNFSGVYESNERYEIGTITNSTGTDGIQAVGYIVLPQWQFNPSSNVSMRVIKTRDGYVTDACPSASSGQAEDYRMVSGVFLGINDFSISGFKYYPNPANDVLNVSNDKAIDVISIYNLLGQKVQIEHPNAVSVKMNIASLNKGTYFVKAESGSALKTFKLIKQ